MATLFLLGRVLFGGYFLYSGISHFTNSKGLTGYAKMKKVPQASLAVIVTGILLVVGGAGIILNSYTQESVVLLLVFLVPTTFAMHAFWKGEDVHAKANDKVGFMKNLALIGALLMML